MRLVMSYFSSMRLLRISCPRNCWTSSLVRSASELVECCGQFALLYGAAGQVAVKFAGVAEEMGSSRPDWPGPGGVANKFVSIDCQLDGMRQLSYTNSSVTLSLSVMR